MGDASRRLGLAMRIGRYPENKWKGLICKVAGHKKKLIKVSHENIKSLSNHKGRHKHRQITWGKLTYYDVVCARCGKLLGEKAKYRWKK